MTAAPLSPHSQLMELEEASTAAPDDLSSFFALLPAHLLSHQTLVSSSASLSSSSPFAFPLSRFVSLPSMVAALSSPPGSTKPRIYQHVAVPAVAVPPTAPAFTPASPTPPPDCISPPLSRSLPLSPGSTAAIVAAGSTPTSAPALNSSPFLPSSSTPLAQSQHSDNSAPTSTVLSAQPAATSILMASTPASADLTAPSVLGPLHAQSETVRAPKNTPKAVYNRSYVRGFARPPPPDPSLTADTAAAVAADTASPHPPPFVAAEDDPTSNHYSAAIFRHPLTLAQLLDICSDPMILSSLPTPGILVTRLTAQGKPREYVMYRCSVCGKEVGDKSKHKKHEASCKKRILKMLNAAEREEERQKNAPVAVQADQEPDEQEKGKEEKRRKKVVAVATSPASTTVESAAPSRGRAELSTPTSRQQPIEKSELYQLELKKQLKWIWHTMDVNPATCLLSRDSVLARIDLTQMFTEGASGLDVFSALCDDERSSLMQYLPQLDQAAATTEKAEQKGGVKQEFPVPRSESVVSTLRSTLSSAVFLRSLDEYKRQLMSGSLDPALKGLRMMAAARRRRQQRETEPNKPSEAETYWGEQLSEVKVKVTKPAVGKNGRALLGGWRGLLGKKHKAVPAGPSGSQNGHADEGRSGSSRDSGQEEEEEQENQRHVKEDEEEDTAEEDQDEQTEHTASDTDTDNGQDKDTGQEQKSDNEDEEEAEAEEEIKGHTVEEEGGRRPLHRARHRPGSTRKRSRRRFSSRPSRSHQQSTSEQSSSGSLYSPFHIDHLLPLPLQLKLPTTPLPDVIPSIQRFHMRSPRFRRVRYARFVLKDGRSSLIDVRDVSSSSSPSARRSPPTAPKQRAMRDTASHSLSPVAFSHLSQSSAAECMQLQRRMMDPEEKRAAQQRIRQARSVRVRQMEQDRLNAALEAEAQMLQLVEAAAANDSSSGRKKDRRWNREDAERQQRVAHGLKRPRGTYDTAAQAADDEEIEEEEEQQDDEQAEEEETYLEEEEADARTMHSKQSNVDNYGDEPLSRLPGVNGGKHESSGQDSDGEDEVEEGDDEEKLLSRLAKQETHLHTPVFPRSKFGFSSFIKQALGSHA